MSNIFRDVLMARGISNGQELAQRLESPAAIFFLASGKPHAELRYWDAEGAVRTSRHWPRHPNTMSMPAMRRKTVEAAQQEATRLLGLPDWAKSPFDNCWLPRDVLEDARKQYMAAETA